MLNKFDTVNTNTSKLDTCGKIIMATDNKSLATNLIALVCIGVGYLIPTYGAMLTTAGFFALSGALTNWLAIYMLFERIPFLYGSGIVPLHFQEFKEGIKNLIMQQFFTEESIKRFFETQMPGSQGLPVDHILEGVDFDLVYERLIEAILESKLGGMLAFVGGQKALMPLKAPIIQKLQSTIREVVESERFQKALIQESISQEVHQKIQFMVDERLEELTPLMVKKIIQDMIQKHLGWLVVWGGIFGGLIGIFLEIIHLVD
jgi:uncharacterized membrane protein YheB (UPF0754 family)